MGGLLWVIGFILSVAISLDTATNKGRILSFVTLLAGWAALAVVVSLGLVTWQETQAALWVCFGAVAYFGIRTFRGK